MCNEPVHVRSVGVCVCVCLVADIVHMVLLVGVHAVRGSGKKHR